MVETNDLVKDVVKPIVLVDFDGQIIGSNNQAEQVFATTSEQLLGADLVEFFSTIDQKRLKKEISSIDDSSSKEVNGVSLFSKDDFKQVDLQLDLIKTIEDSLVTVSVVNDLYSNDIPDKNPNPVLKVDNNGAILYANSAGNEMLKNCEMGENNRLSQEHLGTIQNVIETKDSRELTIQLEEEIYMFTAVFDADTNSVYLYGQDITGLKEANKHIEQLANYDSLLGLPNRNLFIDRLTQLIIKANEQEELIGVLFLDIDDFKRINDTFGHQAGDKLLNDVAEKLDDCLTKNDTLARLSGDQFGIVINGMQELTKLNQLIENIMNKFKYPFTVYSDPFDGAGKEIFISISIGVSLYPQDSTDVDQLIKNAEVAMHKVKQADKDNYQFFSKEMNESFLHELELEAKLRRALDKDEFKIYYQPQISIGDNEVTGLEALLRWDNQELGLVSPGRFIPLAERTGLILEIGSWVLRQACQETKRMQQELGRNFGIAINLSPRQFRDDKLIDKVEQALDLSGLNPNDLTLEITENIIMEDIEQSIEILVELKEQGINISVDDFGTGYSSLNYLSSFPLDELKIDRSFIMDIPDDREKISISKAVINLAHVLKLNVVAEGAETIEQVDFLKENNCDQIQGYYYSKPVPETDIVQFVEQNNDF
ncbi:MAG: EAL domain-containing protein [Bacillota bacterium]